MHHRMGGGINFFPLIPLKFIEKNIPEPNNSEEYRLLIELSFTGNLQNNN